MSYRYKPHARTFQRVAPSQPSPDVHTRAEVVRRLPLNLRIGARITKIVGSMWCAYAFAALALVSLPTVLATGSLVLIVAWIAQTFLQLVLLSVIIVGQNISQAASDARAESTYKDAEAVLHEAVEIQRHLHAQDELLQLLHGKIDGVVLPAAATSSASQARNDATKESAGDS